jgi:hypothetical protein
MTDLGKGTEGKEAVAPSAAEGASSDALALNSFASNSRARSKAPLLCGALGLGMAVGWLGHGFQVKEARNEARAASRERSDEGAGPCRAWANTICERMGELAYECTEARVAATTLLSDSVCEQAQESVLAKVDAIKSERSQCSELTSKLCADLGPEGKGCEFVKAKEPVFSLAECQDMTRDYKQVLARVMERQTKGTIPSPPRAHQPGNVSISRPN